MDEVAGEEDFPRPAEGGELRLRDVEDQPPGEGGGGGGVEEEAWRRRVGRGVLEKEE